jgi:hypothetical protein
MGLWDWDFSVKILAAHLPTSEHKQSLAII